MQGISVVSSSTAQSLIEGDVLIDTLETDGETQYVVLKRDGNISWMSEKGKPSDGEICIRGTQIEKIKEGKYFVISILFPARKIALQFEKEAEQTKWFQHLQSVASLEEKGTTYKPEKLEDVSLETGAKEETLGMDAKNLIFELLKQVTTQMDLSKVTLPTFILEPKSMLEKVTEFMTHTELLVLVPKIEDPLQRMLGFIKWYLSGFYIKPKGVKKPYNPILGEIFRCMWDHGDSKTFYVAEQVSHHPPISAFYASNRKAGFVLNGAILFKSRFYGTSAGSLLEGTFSLHLIEKGEEYECGFPSAYAKGFVWGTLLMEMIGVVTAECKETGYKASIDFQQKPLWGGDYNMIGGTLNDEEEPIYKFSGKWDERIEIEDIQTQESEVIWNPTLPEVRKNRAPRSKPEELFPNESERLWAKVSAAIKVDDQVKATEEKTVLEKAQREAASLRKEMGADWVPRLFEKDEETGKWEYKYINKNPWNPEIEIEEFEKDGIIQSRMRKSNEKKSQSVPASKKAQAPVKETKYVVEDDLD